MRAVCRRVRISATAIPKLLLAVVNDVQLVYVGTIALSF